MSLCSIIKKLRQAAMLTLLAVLASSCQWMTEDYADERTADKDMARYINITISVSASESPVTRANPTGGETGDGLEMGKERENKVDNITLILYEDAAGINTSSTDTKVAFMATYPVGKTGSYNNTAHDHQQGQNGAGWTGESDANEVIYYTTGDQKFDDTLIDDTKTYHAIVVANAPDALLASITVNSTTIAQVRDMVLTTVYDGTGVHTDARKFVMSSERDATVSFTNRKVDNEKNAITYYFECIHIERLAARIDFLAKTKNPTTGSYVASQYVEAGNGIHQSGYHYSTLDTNKHGKHDLFVLTRITPFNLMTGDEYLLKRTSDDENQYLAKETTTNWVLDPYSAQTDGKPTIDPTDPTYPTYLTSTLTSVMGNFDNDFTVTLSDCQTAPTADEEAPKFSIDEGTVRADNIILSYPKENTLRGGVSNLYYYATGLAFEGYYYEAAGNSEQFQGNGKRKVFYYFLRHQGEQDAAYTAFTAEDLDPSKLCPDEHTGKAMNFGIVRNNIYRVSIESVSVLRGKLKIRLEEEKWRHVDNPVIYI